MHNECSRCMHNTCSRYTHEHSIQLQGIVLIGMLISTTVVCAQTETFEDWLGQNITRHKYDAKVLEKENEATMLTDLSKPAFAVIINEAAKNKWGSPKGYKVLLSRPAHNLYTDSFAWNKGIGARPTAAYCCELAEPYALN